MRVGAPKGGAQKGGAPKGGGRRVGGPEISLFFFSLLHHIFLSSFSLLGSLLHFGCFLKRRGPEMCTFGVPGLSCASPGGPVCVVSGLQKHHANT